MLVLELDAAHDHDAAHDQRVSLGIAWRASAVFDAAHDRCHAVDDGPGVRHTDFDTTPHREHIDDRFAVDRGLPQVDRAAAHESRHLATSEVAGATGALHAAQNRDRVDHAIAG